MTKKPSIEELLNVAKNTKGKVKYSEKEINSDVKQFLLKNQIKSGKILYNQHYIYLMYLGWTKKDAPVDSILFHKILRKRLKHVPAGYKIEMIPVVGEDSVKKLIVKQIMKRAEKHVKETNQEEENKEEGCIETK